MGVVYEAIQESLGRHVALKVLSSAGRIDSTYRERFRLEARSAARLHHTHIVPVYGVGEHGGVPYYAMQFIPGCGLDAVLDDLRKLRAGGGAGTPPVPGTATVTTLSESVGAIAGGGRGRAAPETRTVLLRPSRILRRRLRPLGDDRPGLLSGRGEAGSAGRRGPGSRAFPGRAPSRHQALEPPARRRRQGVGDRLRPGEGRGERRADPHRRHRWDPPVHGPRTVRRLVRPPERRLRPGGHALRDVDPPPCPRCPDSRTADREGPPRSASASQEDRPPGASRPGDGRVEGHGPGAGRSLSDGSMRSARTWRTSSPASQSVHAAPRCRNASGGGADGTPSRRPSLA